MIGKPTAVVVLLVVLGLVAPERSAAQTVFPGAEDNFSDDIVVEDVANFIEPTALAWLPNQDFLIATQPGRLFRSSPDGQTVTDLSLPIQVCHETGDEMGLLGVAVDPDFDSGAAFLYVYYTNKKGPDCSAANRANRLSRFSFDPATNALGNEQILIDNIAARAGNHNAGDLQFGRDDLLYISVGDSGADLQTGKSGAANANAQNLGLLNGKILRITRDGAIPSGNPFQGNGTTRCSDTGAATGAGEATKKQNKKKKKNKMKGDKTKKQKKRERKRERKRRNRQRDRIQSPKLVCQEIFASGLRNPFRIAFDPDDSDGVQRLFINDVGEQTWEEISEGAAGANYGWSGLEGPCPVGVNCDRVEDTEFVEPLFAYNHQDTGCSSITGGAFVPDYSGWTGYVGLYLYADYTCGKIFALDPDDPGNFGDPPVEFATGMGRFQGAIHLAFGPDGNFYYTTFANGGQVRKIEFTPDP